MSPASVTLASALQARAEALSEEEIWSLLFLAAERLLEDLREGSSDYVVCPWSTLLSVFGSLSFQGRVSHVEAAPFRAPELLQPRSSDEPPDAAQMHVYSLGATLCWSAGFRVPASQPLQLREPLHSVLLSMCEDQPGRRRPLCSVLDACWLHREAAAHPVSANLHVRQLVGMVLGTISEVSVVSGRSTEAQSSLEPGAGTSTHRGYDLCVNSAPPAGAPQDFPEGRRPRSAPTLSAGAHDSWPDTPSPKRFLQRKGKFSRPEFVLLAAEAPVTLHLPGAIVTKKGKSCWTLRDLCVVLLSGQNLEVKCDITSTVGAVFDAVTSFANLAELTYFGLAYMTGKEFFFLDNKTRLCKISPDGWGEQPQKTSSRSFTLFLRVKFFVSHHGLLRQSQTRHQLYLQLRKDVLEEKLYCSDETQLRLGVLALQAEFGSYPETVGTQAYFRVEDYVPASLIEKMSALGVQRQVSAMHRLSPVLGREDAELEFLRVTQQLPEYGVLVHRVLAEKARPAGDMALGICAKGLIVYEVKNGSRIATLRFQWREIGKISTYRKKFTITSSITGKKHTFVTDSAKTCKYLLGFCSAQHGFNARMNAPRLASDYDKHVQMASWSLAHLAQSKPLTRTQRLSCSENALPAWRLEDPAGGLLGTSLDSVAVDTRSDTGAPDIGGSPNTGREQLESVCSVQKPMPRDPLSGLPVGSVCTVLGSQNKRRDFTAELDREIVHVTLNRDPRRGFGFVINEGEDVGKADPGIFISSIVPGGPAEKAKTIKPGGQILALNHISLEGFPFDMAVRMIQNSPDSIELIISQPKGVGGDTPSEEKNSAANSGVFSPDSLSEGHGGSCSSHTQDQRRSAEEMETTGTQGSLSRWTPRPRTLPLKDAGSSCPPSLSETNASGIYFVELVKEGGTLGFSVTGGIDTSVLCGGIYVKSIVPGGPAAKEGQVLRGDRLLQVDGRSLCGLTHKQAVQCLKGSGQVARLVLERRGPRTAQPCPCVNDRMGVECTAVSLATASPDRPASCASATDGAKFEVKLRKHAGGLGFSFVQTERDSCSHLKSDLVRIKRLFPGQPAEESGAIAAGDVILAVNGKPTEGLVFQEVLHLLRGPSPEVTLLLCRPPPGVLPELGQGWQTPVTDQDLARASDTDSGQSPSREPEGSRRDSASPDAGGGLDPGPEAFRQATGEAQWDQDRKRPWASSLRRPGDPHPHVCGLHREAEATALEKDVRRNCYSVGDIRRLDSPKLDRDDEEGEMSHPPKVPSPAVEDEVFLPINYPSGDQLPCGKCLEADSGAIPLPQSCSSGALSESLPLEGPHGSESEWEDLEEIVDPDAGALR